VLQRRAQVQNGFTGENHMLETLTYDTVLPLVGTSMFVDPEKDHRVELRIIHVGKVMESERALLQRDAFSIFFAGPKSYKITQGSYPTRHDAFPEPFFLFLVPLEEQEEFYVYEAVFT
jgi:hypothetical protein